MRITFRFLPRDTTACVLFALISLASYSQGVPASASAKERTIAIRAGNLIDPRNGSIAKNQVIIVKNKRIVAKGADLAIPKDAEVVDLRPSRARRPVPLSRYSSPNS